MRLLRKVIASGLAAVTAVSITACGNSASNNLSGKSSEKPYEVVMAYVGDSYPDMPKVEEAMSKILLEKFNCTIKMLPLSWGEFEQKLTLMLSGNEKLDLVPMIGGKGVGYLNNGYVIDIHDLLEKYGGNIKAQIGEENMYIATVDGKTFGVPNNKDWVYQHGIMMRKDLLDASGYTVADITSLEDLGKVYAKVKEQNPGMIMLDGRSGWTPGRLLQQYDKLGDELGVIMPDDKVGTVVNYYETEEFKNISRIMYDFNQKGYISKDVAISNSTTNVREGLAFSYLTRNRPDVVQQDSQVNGYSLVFVPLTGAFRSTDAMTTAVYGIGRNCENPELVMQVLDYMYGSPELMNLFNWGIEGEHYVIKDKDAGIITFPDGVTAENTKYRGNMTWMLPNQFIAYKMEGVPADIWDRFKEWNKTAPIISTGFIFDNKNVLTEISALNNVRAEYLDAIGAGAVDPEIAIPELNEKLKAAGLDKVIEEKQKQLDAFLKK